MTQNEIESEIIPDETENETGSEPDQDQTEAESPNAEAKRYRLQLRQAEQERDTLTAQLEAARRQIVEAHAGLRHPAALWELGTDVHAMFTDDGQLDTNKLRDVTRDAAERLGLARPPMPPHLGKTNGPPASRDRFADAFRPRDR